MRRSPWILILIVFLTFGSVSPARSWWWDHTLVSIDGVKHTTEDFKRWWKYWNDSEMALPKTPEPYVDWLLLAREGERMRLSEDPSFQRATAVFLKVRSLLLLKKEEIDGKIEITDDELRERYEKRYTPLWLLQRLQFKDENAAKTAWQGLKDGTLSIDEVLKRPPEEGGPMHQREDWRRPVGMDEEWSAIFKKLSVGQASEPIAFGEHFVFYRLKEQKGGDAQDFDKLGKEIRQEVWKEKEAALSRALISKLRKKFEVRVDQERFDALDLNAPDDTYSDAPVIYTNRQNVSERDFVAVARRQSNFRQLAAHGGEKLKEVKEQVLTGIINQNLTDWEALDRRYQEREPFKWEYQFNVSHRLTKAIEERLFVQKATVTQEEIKRHYEENVSRYSQPEMVKLVLIGDMDGDVDRVWAEVAAGKDFLKALREHTRQKDTAREVPFNHLDRSMQEVVNRLAKGETSQPFESQGHRFMLRLVDRKPSRPIPFEQVSDAIRRTLGQEKVEQQRRTYLDLLKSRSKIKVSDSDWEAVRKELGGAK